jgi:hypothetical protein
MIRNLKVMIAAALALAAIGAVGASGAQAAEFHCSVEPCKYKLKPDGAVPTKAAHHVFIVKNAAGESLAFTCNQLTGEATSSTKTFTTITVTALAYDGCVDPFTGNPLVFTMNGCSYTFTSHGKFGISCPAGKRIELKFGGAGCIITFGEFADIGGVTYKTIGTMPNREITVEMKVVNVPITLDGTTGQCIFNVTKTPFIAEFTTANMILAAESDDGKGTIVDGWWE